MNITSHPKRPQRLFLIAVGAFVSAVLIYCVFFALTNDAWIVISTPTLPWRTDGPVPLFEARLWAIILGAFGSGVALTLFFWLLSARRRSKLSKHIKRLEEELDQTKRLLAASSQKAAPQGAEHDDLHRFNGDEDD